MAVGSRSPHVCKCEPFALKSIHRHTQDRNRAALIMDDEIAMPCAAALLAGTMALMTAYAQPEAPQGAETLPGPGGGPDTACDPRQRIGDAAQARRVLLARKVVSNLFFLREHPGVDDGLRKVAARMHAHWTALLRHHEALGAAAVPGAARTALDATERPASALLH